MGTSDAIISGLKADNTLTDKKK